MWLVMEWPLTDLGADLLDGAAAGAVVVRQGVEARGEGGAVLRHGLVHLVQDDHAAEEGA